MPVAAAALRVWILLVPGTMLATGAACAQSAKNQASQPQLLTAKIDFSGQSPDHKYTITGVSRLRIKRATVEEEDEEQSGLRVHVTIDECSAEVARGLVVKAGDKVFLPRTYFGNGVEAISILELQGVDRASAELLTGAPLADAPKDSFRVDMVPLDNGTIFITLVNVGKAPLKVYWGTRGGRDKQLSFTATLDGVPVPPDPKPLSDGFIMSPFDAKPNSPLKRTANLSEWLQFQKPGNYMVEATYRLVIENPQPDSSPREWTVTYHNRFPVTWTATESSRGK
jgi:hypothetical protein